MAIDRTMRSLEQATLPFFLAPYAERGVVASGERRVIRGECAGIDRASVALLLPSSRAAVGRVGELHGSEKSRGGGSGVKVPPPLTPPHRALRARAGGEATTHQHVLNRRPDVPGNT